MVIEVTPHEIVLCKPPGLASELPRDPAADSLVTRLSALGYSDVRLVHRLDSPACGLMIVARTAEAAAHYFAEIAARRWQKLYVAAVSAPAAQVRALIGPHKAYLSTEGRRATVVRAGGKPSFLTLVHVAEAAAGQSHVLVHLHTGRFHQIRVMLAHLGAPLVGDDVYGGSTDGRFYLEQAMLGARPFGSSQPRLWRAPSHNGRPAWADDLARAIDAQERTLLNEA